MEKIFTFLLHLLFPPTKEELLLLSISPSDFSLRATRAPNSPFSFITPLFAYKDPLVKELIWQLKYKKSKHALLCAGSAFNNQISKNSDKKTILIPIPISKKRRRERGFNQCELIIDEIMKLDTQNRFEKRFDVLEKTKHISDQKLKNREERLASSQSIFRIHERNPLPLDSTIIIIDDVVTTGSTLREARETFMRAGYTQVRAMTLGH